MFKKFKWLKAFFFIGAGSGVGAGEKNTRSRSQMDRLPNTGSKRASQMFVKDMAFSNYQKVLILDSSKRGTQMYFNEIAFSNFQKVLFGDFSMKDTKCMTRILSRCR